MSAEQFRKRPVEVAAIPVEKAINLADQSWDKLPDWLAEAYERGEVVFASDHITVKTIEGQMHAEPGWWIIRGVKGELYPCRGDIFTDTYEPVGPPTAADIEIVERSPMADNVHGVIVPNEIRINGAPVLIPYGKNIKVHKMEFPPQDAVLVTLTLFARRVTIGADAPEAVGG